MAKLVKRLTEEKVLEDQEIESLETVEEEVIETEELEDEVDGEEGEELEESAVNSLRPNSAPVGPANKSFKSVAIGQVVNAMAGMDQETINKFVATIAQIGHEADNIPDGDANKNKNTLSTKPSAAGVQLVTKLESTEVPVGDLIKEDVSAIFEGEELSDEFKGKVSTLIESVINLKVDQRLVAIEEEYSEKYEAELETITENLVSTMDDFLTYATEEWAKKNEVAIVSNLRADLTEEFIEGLKALFETHYIQVPEEKVDVVEEMSERIEQLEAETNEKLEEIASLKAELLQKEGEMVVESLTKGMTESDAVRLRELAETVEFSNTEDLVKKVTVLKEQYFKEEETESKEGSSKVLFEESEKIDDGAEEKRLPGPMASYVDAIGRAVRH